MQPDPKPQRNQVWAETTTRNVRILQVVPARGDKSAYVIAVECDAVGAVIGRGGKRKIPYARFVGADSPFRLVTSGSA